MTKEIISTGNTANDGTGDTLRSAGIKINSNFTELYSHQRDKRVTEVQTTGTLNTGNNGIINFTTLTATYMLKSVACNKAARVGIYNSLVSAKMDSDTGRAFGTPVDSASHVGLIAESLFVGDSSRIFAPGVVGYRDSDGIHQQVVKVRNDAASGTVQVTIKAVKLEDSI